MNSRNTTRAKLRSSVTSLLLPLAAVLAAAACGSEGNAPSGTSGGPGSGGRAGTITGGGGSAGTSVSTGGSGSAGTSVSTGGSGTAGALTSGGTAGTTTGGATTGGAATGGAATGGAGTGGAGSGSGPTFHIFMLMGQSNMAGVAKFDQGDKNTDARLKVLGGCNQPAGQWNTANPPLNDCPGEKGWNLSDTVDPGIWFGKTILAKLPAGDTIGLVGTAESGESINTFITGGSHHQMILNKIAKAKTAEHAHFAGIIFHQGESDSGQSSSPAWSVKVVQLYKEVKAAWGVSYDVPFILGELPAGGCCSGHNTEVHAAAELLPIGAWVSQEGTKVLDQYHFDHASVLLMGKRYGDKMIEELKW